jgi:hypothetical protein
MAEMVLNRSRFQEAEFQTTTWVATVEQGTTMDQIQNPAFWSHISTSLRPYDKIQIRWDDGVAYAEFLVLSCDRSYAKVKELFHVELTTADVAMSENDASHKIDWKGPHRKFAIIRKADGAIIKEGFDNKKQAQVELESYLNATA